MKKMKKFFAMLLTLAMVMGLSLTAFADGNASIKVKGLVAGETTTLNIYKVVALNTEDSTWEVTNEAYAPFVDFTEDPVDVNWEELKEVLVDGTEVTTTAAQYEFTGLDIGLYAITASGATEGTQTTTYSIMGTNTYTYDETTNLIVARNVEITAKGENYTITKTLVNEDLAFAGKGDEVQFNITMVFPSYGEGTENRTFNITDTPTGMKVTSVDSVTVGSTDATVGTDYTVTGMNSVADQAVTVNFTPAFIGTENAHAGQTVVVTLTAVVTDDTEYSNEASSNMTETPSTVEGNSGSITINKVDEEQKSLTGARFTVGENGTALEFVLVGEENKTVTYTLKTDDVEGTAVTELGTDTASTIVVKGLGAGTYEITETKAPEGYSVVEVDDVTLAGTSEATRNVATTVVDTQLATLPSTGGIGTTIFTVGGCAIMIIAAGLYFSLRRRSAK